MQSGSTQNIAYFAQGRFVFLQDVIYEAMDDITPPQLDSDLPAHKLMKYDTVYNKFVESVMSQRDVSRRRRQGKSEWQCQ